MGAKLLRDSISIQLMLTWSYRERKDLLFLLKDQIPFYLRD
jgi:hypothetical protein